MKDESITPRDTIRDCLWRKKLKDRLRSDKTKLIFILIVSVSASIFLVSFTGLWEREEPHMIVLFVIGMSFFWTLSGIGAMFKT